MQQDGLIQVYGDQDRKTIYDVTELGMVILQQEIRRIKEVHQHVLQYEEALVDEKD